MLGKPFSLSLFPNLFNKSNKTGAFIKDPLYICLSGHFSRDMRFQIMRYVRPAKAQTSLRIRAV